MSQSVILRPDEDGKYPFFNVAGNSLQEQLSETQAVGGVLTFAENIKTIEIYNIDPTNTGTFTVNGIVIQVPPTKVFKSDIGGVPSKLVTVTGSTDYTVSRYT